MGELVIQKNLGRPVQFVLADVYGSGDEVHDGRAIGGRPRSWRILYFDPARLDETRADILGGAHKPFTFAQPVFADPVLSGLFERAFVHAIARMASETAHEAAILKLIARLGTHSTARTSPDEGPTACIRRARERIDADPPAPITLAELAKEAGLSRYQLLRAFARELGLTPHAYILQRRVALAQRLIRGGTTLADAAAIAGFYDQSHLHRCFVRQFGVTPRRYALAG